jgi:hypothetical protein
MESPDPSILESMESPVPQPLIESMESPAPRTSPRDRGCYDGIRGSYTREFCISQPPWCWAEFIAGLQALEEEGLPKNYFNSMRNEEDKEPK